MSIELLRITDFRNIQFAEINCASHFNLFYGQNAAGKTSLLEAVYYLSNGKSFQTHLHEIVIQNQKNQFSVFAALSDQEAQLGLQRSRDGKREARLNQSSASQAELSLHLPIQFISANSHYILTDGPKPRREFLDWGLFHTNPDFYPIWKQYQKLLAQRNAALKARAPHPEMQIWNSELAKAGEALHALRNLYLLEFIDYFNKLLEFFKLEFINISYFSGWDENLSLAAALEKNLFREYQMTYTLSGPHRADLKLSIENISAENRLSQGQQKLVSYALRLAQGLHLSLSKNKSPIFLIDDLASELDAKNKELVIQFLLDLKAQVFLTCIESSDFSSISAVSSSVKLFHVKHGKFFQSELTKKTECFT